MSEPRWTQEREKQYQKEYHKEYYPKHYEANREYYLEKTKKRKGELRLWLEEYKAKLSCSRCPENHPSCLEFHHTDPKEKEIAIAETINKGWGMKRILAEIEKCEVLCSNCHRKLHWELRKN